MIVADERYHQPLRAIFERDADMWILPWAILPEVDYLLTTRVGTIAQQAFS